MSQARNTLKINQRKFKKNVRKSKFILERLLPKEALEETKRNTPRDRGNARRNTKLKKRNKGFQIISDYEYSGVIDDGLYGKPQGTANGPKTSNGYSKQAPKGIYKPTIQHLAKYLRKKFRRF